MEPAMPSSGPPLVSAALPPHASADATTKKEGASRRARDALPLMPATKARCMPGEGRAIRAEYGGPLGGAWHNLAQPGTGALASMPYSAKRGT